jgi:hypothetical protein
MLLQHLRSHGQLFAERVEGISNAFSNGPPHIRNGCAYPQEGILPANHPVQLVGLQVLPHVRRIEEGSVIPSATILGLTLHFSTQTICRHRRSRY